MIVRSFTKQLFYSLLNEKKLSKISEIWFSYNIKTNLTANSCVHLKSQKNMFP